LREIQKIPADEIFKRFDPKSPEGKFLKERGEQLYKEISGQHALKEKMLPTSKNKFCKMANAPRLSTSI
jgi:pyruvate dehydrogenase E1 component